MAPPTHYYDASYSLIRVDVGDSYVKEKPVRISVVGDIVDERFYVDGTRYILVGERRAGHWLDEEGKALVYLSPGNHEILAYSCFQDGFSWKCGCRTPDDCGYWMSRTFSIE